MITGLIAATIAGALFWFLWHHLLFKKTKEEKVGLSTRVGLEILASFLTSFILVTIFSSLEIKSVAAALSFSLIAWLGFYLSTEIKSAVLERKSAGYLVTHSIYLLLWLSIISILISVFS